VTDIPRFTVLIGRGNVGKSTLGIWLAETARAGGREFLIGNMDPTLATIGELFPDFVSPEYADDDDREKWLTETIEQQQAKGQSLLLDTGGNDPLLPRYARRYDLVPTLQDQGIEPVAIHVLGPDLSDLALFSECEECFAPKRTILVLNGGRAGKHIDLAFAEVRADPDSQAARARGAREVVMPRLDPMQKIASRKLSFSAAAIPGKDGLGFMDAKLVDMWLKTMKQQWGPVGEVL
jgi:hypothetical protein